MLSGAHLINVLEKGNMIDGVFLLYVVSRIDTITLVQAYCR
jgi:hypothetical protein